MGFAYVCVKAKRNGRVGVERVSIWVNVGGTEIKINTGKPEHL